MLEVVGDLRRAPAKFENPADYLSARFVRPFFFAHADFPFFSQCGAWSQARKSIRLQLPDRARSSVLPLQTVNGLFNEGFAIRHLVQHDWRAIV